MASISSALMGSAISIRVSISATFLSMASIASAVGGSPSDRASTPTG